MTGQITDRWEITAGYTYLDGKTLASTVAANVGKQMPNVARNAVNLWTEYEFSEHFELGVGGNYLGKRYADFAEQAVLPELRHRRCHGGLDDRPTTSRCASTSTTCSTSSPG